ncbi:MFS transporter [Pseudonocardia sp. KRD-184]|uniref:MFS transporter n=1 Tax=Pseudonocardia oceani TaxID=2792013 RepID=A0ABS6UJK7_9PSEU|nr:MFS transporter [Pseudonocardia oceani]MBW0093554.1 MFS transporter [Pseudonocardia oceani]MBW0098425.1 MFS transporter [Pseudonocardia oceani]MBW0112150.1 MFS transporter [Pseudonocardia oceani]MBW0120803.1 MFS transporter [Pseudonocardia oceani]MBW0132442.1 MFS transporter [Pseudonocardia oceani]
MSTATTGDTTGTGTDRVFRHLLADTLLVSVTHFTAWFAITFFVYLQTRSVVATGVIAGLFLVMTSLSGIWFGSLVDHHRKRTVMIASNAVSLVLYTAAFALYLAVGDAALTDPTSPLLWGLVLLVMSGVIVGNLRGIAMSTAVTLLVPAERRDRANGLVGTASGVSFLVTSVISGLLVGLSGMFHVLVLALVVVAGSAVHLLFLRIPGDRVAADESDGGRIDLRGTLLVVTALPGLVALIAFSTINNFLGGVYMALLDAYGLSLMSVQAWGLLFGVLSTGFILGGLVIARRGLGPNPLRSLLLANVGLWVIATTFTLHRSVVLFAIGMYLYMSLIPWIEASEQTVLQKVVPFERQGRVFGFAQSVEQAASPLTAFLISPVAQFVFIPFMTTGAGVDLIGGWFGTGPDRGLALVFVLTGLVGLAVTLAALRTRQYRDLSERYARAAADGSAAPVTPAATG